MNRYVHAIFCDDIRQEAGAKQTLVGIYRDQLQLPAIPVVLPRLCVVVDVVTPVTQPFDHLVIQASLGEQQIARAELAASDLRSLRETASRLRESSGPEARITFSANFVFSPLQIDHATLLGVRVDTGAEELRANALRIVLAPDAIPAPTSQRMH
ncbi:MAG: hypothetical protein J0H15_11115 [Xanthomonadales bacterium]|nr:hypothetical protein [Xanthomonadales bacterium]